MEVKSLTKFARIAPRKAHDLARAIQGKSVQQALQITQFSERKAATLIGKTLKSAVANAENNHELDVDEMVVRLAVIEEGPRMKRGFYGARGMHKRINKRTSHIRIVLATTDA